MNDRKLKKLFELTRGETPSAPPDGFDSRVMFVLRREPRAGAPSLWDQLEQLFPRLAVAMVLVIGICVAGDFAYSALHPADLTADVHELADQWLLASNED
jgi:hypothetical protein